MAEGQTLKRLSYKDGYEYLFSHLNSPDGGGTSESFVCET
jgi:hypothetical protein